MIAIINASPLIYLSKVGAIELLPKMFTKVITTTTVKTEVLQQEKVPEHIVLKESFDSWLEVEQPRKKQLIKRLLGLQIHQGEAEVIALAREHAEAEKESVIVIDDLHAREIAASLGLIVTGTIGILLRALNKKVIGSSECRLMVEKLVTKTTFRLSTKLYAQILREIEREK